MELGSSAASVLATSQDDPVHASSSNGAPFNTNTALSSEISTELDGMEDQVEGIPAGTLQETGEEHEFVERKRDDPEANFEPEGTEADDHGAGWIAGLKLASDAKAFQRGRNARRQTFFMIRMPRYADNQLRSKIKVAELQLEEASKTRDVIRAALQLKRASKIGLLDKLKVVRDKERACKDMVQKKRLEIEPFQAILSKFKSADVKFKEEIFSEEDLDNKIAQLQHRIQHESIPLREEKQLIREIKQLESQRSQVCANDAEHVHLLESYGPKEDIQEHLDILYRELDVLRAQQNQARLDCEPIEKELEDLNVKIDELVEQLEGAKRAQAAALTVCKELKKCLSEQNAEFYRSKDDIRKARELAFSKNVLELAALCHEQVESILMRWNSDSGFRERYIKNNEPSTLRRLETLDGRSLGPDEEPLLLMSDMELISETLPKVNESDLKKGLQKEVIAEIPSSSGPGNHKVKKLPADEVKLQADRVLKGSSSKTEKTTNSNSKSEGKVAQKLESVGPTVAPSAVPVEDAAAKEAQAAALKEKRRQEEIAKAKEAAERKRRQAERTQAKAQLRAQREAERREKERERKAKKKAAVATEDVKPVEDPNIEESKTEPVIEDLSGDSVKAFSSQGRRRQANLPKARRHPVVSALLKRKMWQVPYFWLWVSLVILMMGLALLFVVKF